MGFPYAKLYTWDCDTCFPECCFSFQKQVSGEKENSSTYVMSGDHRLVCKFPRGFPCSSFALQWVLGSRNCMPTSGRFCFFLNYAQNMQPNPPVKDSQHASSHSTPCKGICFYGGWSNVWNHEVNLPALVVGLCLHSLRLKTPKCQSQVLLKPSWYGCKQNNFPHPDIFHFPKLNTVKCIRQRSRYVFES